MMRVLLISLQSNLDTIGLKYLHSYLLDHGMESRILFLPGFSKEGIDPILEHISDFDPGSIGISLMSREFEDAALLTDSIKDRFPSTPVIWGGIHPMVDPEGSLKHTDYVIRGEGEEALLRLARRLENGEGVEDSPNLALVRDGEVKMNPLCPLIRDLDTLSFPQHFPSNAFVQHKGKVKPLSGKLFARYSRYSGRFLSLTTTRGCPFSCAYCCNSFFQKLYGEKSIRKRSVGDVIEELRQAKDECSDIVFLDIQDDCFLSYDLEWLKEFARSYKKEIGWKFVCRSTPAHMNEEKVRVLKEAGLSWIMIGLQSGSARVEREIYNRKVSNRLFLETTELVHKYDIAGYYDVILDNPYEREEETEQTLEVLLKIPKPFQLQIFSLCFFQGTEIYQRAKRDGITIEDPSKKDYLRYTPSDLNKLVRLTPLYPKRFIQRLLRRRKKKGTKTLIKALYPPSVIFLEPITWFWLTKKSQDNSLIKAVKITTSLLKFGFNRMIMRRYGY